MLEEHGLEHGNTEGKMAGFVANPVDMARAGGVTALVSAPGAVHPECGSHPDNPSLIRPHNEVRRGPGRVWPKPVAVRVAPGVEGRRWYVVETHRRQEVAVVDALLGMGFEAVAPQFMDVLPANPVRRLPVREVLRPAYPGYVLGEFDQGDPGWRRIASVRGVRGIMGSGPERPTPVLAVTVVWIVAQFGFGGVQRRSLLGGMVVAEPLPVGVWARVTMGPYEGQRGVVQSSNGRSVHLAMGGFRVWVPQVLVAVCV